jgi:hypothetical protein
MNPNVYSRRNLSALIYTSLQRGDLVPRKESNRFSAFLWSVVVWSRRHVVP